jgi:glyoxylase-like metal-dependent hydrolase (beta-lactamase superfamily II)
MASATHSGGFLAASPLYTREGKPPLISLKLMDNVYLVGGAQYGYSAQGDCNCYLVDCGGELALMDAGGGLGVERILENTRKMGFDPKKIRVLFLSHSHFDHIGGAAELKKQTGCRLLAHEDDADSIESLDEYSLYEMGASRGLSFKAPKLDGRLRDNEVVKVGDTEFKAVHSPGHTPGCLVLSFKEHDGSSSLLMGDVAQAGGRLGFINGPGFDLPQWKATIRRLINLKPSRYYPGHGPFVLGGAVDDLKVTDAKMNAPWTTIVTAVG